MTIEIIEAERPEYDKPNLPGYHEILNYICKELKIPGSPTIWSAVDWIKERFSYKPVVSYYAETHHVRMVGGDEKRWRVMQTASPCLCCGHTDRDFQIAEFGDLPRDESNAKNYAEMLNRAAKLPPEGEKNGL